MGLDAKLRYLFLMCISYILNALYRSWEEFTGQHDNFSHCSSKLFSYFWLLKHIWLSTLASVVTFDLSGLFLSVVFTVLLKNDVAFLFLQSGEMKTHPKKKKEKQSKQEKPTAHYMPLGNKRRG